MAPGRGRAQRLDARHAKADWRQFLTVSQIPSPVRAIPPPQNSDPQMYNSSRNLAGLRYLADMQFLGLGFRVLLGSLAAAILVAFLIWRLGPAASGFGNFVQLCILCAFGLAAYLGVIVVGRRFHALGGASAGLPHDPDSQGG